MEDKLLRGLMASDSVKLMAISGKGMVADAQRTHGLSRVCTAALGRTLLMTSMMGAQLKNEDERITTILKGGGVAGNVVCTANIHGVVKGYIENPAIELPPLPNGKLDVATAIGWFGDLTVVRDMYMKEPYVGTCPLTSGEIAEDFARYYAQSEQQPSIVYLGVRLTPQTGDVRSAAGLIVQPMPGCDDAVIDELSAKANDIEKLSLMLDEGAGIEDALFTLFGGMELHLTDSIVPAFRCDCSKERLLKVLVTLGREELMDMIEKEHGAELTCHFCNTKYNFSEDELRALLNEAASGRE